MERKILTHHERIEVSAIQDSVRRAADLIQRNFIITNEFCGWHQYIGERRVGPPATSMGLLILKYAKRKFDYLGNAQEQLRKFQFQTSDPLTDGGWTIRSITRYPITDSTAWVLIGLVSTGELIQSTCIQKGLNWLLINRNKDGGWGGKLGNPSRVWSTFWASWAVSLIQPGHESLHGVVTWLKRSQNADGGWGEIPGKNSTAIHTALALLALNDSGEDPSSKPCRDGVEWLYSHWNPVSMWDGDSKLEEYDIFLSSESWDRVQIRHFNTQWAVTALVRIGDGIFRHEVFRAMKYILAQQNAEGYWPHPASRDRILIWGIHDSLLALVTFASSFGQLSGTGALDLYDNVVVFNKVGTNTTFLSLILLETRGRVLSFARNYWTLGIVVLYLLSIYPLVTYAHFEWKDILIGMIVPILLVFYQVLLQRR